MRIQLREWRDEDTEAWVEVRRALPPPIDDEGLRAIAAGRRSPLLFRAVATLDDEPVGWLGLPDVPDSRLQMMSLSVAPRARGQGVGRLLWSAVPETRHEGHLVWADPDDQRSLAVARHWGFEQVSHGVTSRAALSVPPAPPALPARYRLNVCENSAVDDARLDELLRRSATYPEAAHEGPLTTEHVREMFPDTFWVLVESPDGEVVAASSGRCEHDDEWFVIYTGVLPEHRRLGLARTVKLHLHAKVWARGGRWISTTNEADNHEIRTLNTALGYQVIGGDIRLLRPNRPR